MNVFDWKNLHNVCSSSFKKNCQLVSYSALYAFKFLSFYAFLQSAVKDLSEMELPDSTALNESFNMASKSANLNFEI